MIIVYIVAVLVGFALIAFDITHPATEDAPLAPEEYRARLEGFRARLEEDA